MKRRYLSLIRVFGLFLILFGCFGVGNQADASEQDTWKVEVSDSANEKSAADELDVSGKLNSRFARTFYAGYSGTIKIVKYDASTGALVGGAQFTIYDQYNRVVQVVQTNAGTGSVSVSLPAGNYTVKETVAPAGYQLESSVIKVSLCGGRSICLNKYNNPIKDGSIKIVKKNESNQVLSGAVFVVSNQKWVGSLTTNSNGEAQLDNLPYGTYTIIETRAPEGYEIDSIPKFVTISATSKVVRLEIINKKSSGSLVLTKVNQDKQALAGAVFKVTNQNNELVGTLTTDNNGQARLDNLPYGTYTIIETQAPAGYELDTTPKFVTISATNKVVRLEIINKKSSGSLVLTKVDQNNQVLAGAVFKVTNQSNELVGTLTTDSNGQARLDNLPYGTYTIIETQAPAGYELDSTPKTVTISETNKEATITVSNTKSTGRLKIIKTDENNQPLSNAHILVMTSNSVTVASGFTNAEGLFIVDDVPYGDYKVLELEAPAGYETDRNWHYVSVTKNDPNGEAVLTLVNKKIPTSGNLEILKTDDLGNPLQGAVFEVKNSAGVVVAKVITDAQGRALINDLPFGNYIVQEVEAPAGYLSDTTEQEITIGSAGNISVTFTNTKKPTTGSIKIIKYVKDSDPREYLQGVTFTLYDGNGQRLGVYVTDVNGEILIENLEVGQYYVAETEGIPGYIEDTSLYPAEVKAGEITQVIHANEPVTSRGKLKIIKYARNAEGVITEKRLADAYFSVTDSNGNSYEKMTDANGEALFEGLPEGAVTVKELKAPEEYLIEQETYSATITAGQTTELIVYNKKMVNRQGRLFVYVSSLGNSIEGLEYNIINSKKSSDVYTVKTNKFGQISLMLEEGTYVIQPGEQGIIDSSSSLPTGQNARTATFNIYADRFTMVNLSI